ncbi:hypothetical protein ANN_26340 [Periplaneta americana]|uniref:Uncharacterized protein n=1 Tax=Periplaneta americana TaxID=6978 RepID=A0ABQ8S662_PERAM|nr:hypothetical protein ANN_26340 [Periplaneta americana]
MAGLCEGGNEPPGSLKLMVVSSGTGDNSSKEVSVDEELGNPKRSCVDGADDDLALEEERKRGRERESIVGRFGIKHHFASFLNSLV